MADQEDEVKSRYPKTAATDARFPNTNQSYHCFSTFLDFHKCTQLLGSGHAPCDLFKEIYTSICPHAWITRWEQQIQDGTFPGRLPNDGKKKSAEETDAAKLAAAKEKC